VNCQAGPCGNGWRGEKKDQVIITIADAEEKISGSLYSPTKRALIASFEIVAVHAENGLDQQNGQKQLHGHFSLNAMTISCDLLARGLHY
jgi:hypothetical protein